MVDSKEIIPVENSPAYLTYRRYIVTRLHFELAEAGNLQSQEILIKRLKEEINEGREGIFSKDPDDLELKEIILKTCRLILEIRVYAASQTCSTPFIQALYHLFKLTPYHHFAAKGDLKALTETYKTRPLDLKVTDRFYYSPLYDAIMHNQTEIQKFYAEHLMLTLDTTVPILTKQSIVIGAGIEESQRKEFVSLLHWSATWGDIHFIRQAKKIGKINLFCMDNLGLWPIHYAIHQEILDIVPLLYDVQMRTTPNKRGFFLIYEISFRNVKISIKMLEQLIHLGENIHQCSIHGHTILSFMLCAITYLSEQSHLVGLNRRLELAKMLLNMGVDINQISSYAVNITQHKSFVHQYHGQVTYHDAESNFHWELNFPVIITCTKGDISEVKIISDAEIPENTQEEIKQKAAELAIKEFSPKTEIQDRCGLLHRCLCNFPRTVNTQQEKDNRIYFLKVMNFLIKNGIDLSILNIAGHSALEAAEHSSYLGVIHMIQWWRDKYQQKTTEVLREHGFDNSSRSLVFQYLHPGQNKDEKFRYDYGDLVPPLSARADRFTHQ